jgi:hypothetical protein
MAGYVDAQRPFGSDYVQTATGDLALLQDSPNNPVATIQRIQRMIQSIPILRDAAGNAISVPTDRFNVKYGSGAPALVGQNPTPSLESQFRSRILAGLALDPYILPSPPPVVVVSSSPGSGFVVDRVTCTTITGQVVTTPPQQINPPQAA